MVVGERFDSDERTRLLCEEFDGVWKRGCG